MKRLATKIHLNKRQLWNIAIAIVAIILVTLIAWSAYLRFVKGQPWADWTGLGDYTGSLTKDQRGKTLWDWMELLIIPVVLAIGALWFNRAERANELKIAEQRNKSEQEIAADRQREAALQSYIDRMTALLLDKNLRKSEPEDEVRVVARTRTLSTLRALDGTRKGTLLGFIYEAELIMKDNLVINLSRADLTGADMHWATLVGADLSHTNLCETDLSYAILIGANLIDVDLIGANLSNTKLNGANLILDDLSEANLSGAYLGGAYLTGADLTGADLTGADLTGANLNEATVTDEQLSTARSLEDATMPDGKKYDPSYHTFTRHEEEHDTPTNPDAAPGSSPP